MKLALFQPASLIELLLCSYVATVERLQKAFVSSLGVDVSALLGAELSLAICFALEASVHG